MTSRIVFDVILAGLLLVFGELLLAAGEAVGRTRQLLF